ncbi:MAG: hypothetical protein COA62_15265 [Rhodobiaceae bacterium]|nr:MAG: hypothetical protein COA62_16750 [Rhodobiaceae bacterium]PCJ68511.1 MAG: hypothetical protein COA62_15265 [Rhodobiaceae bacterium]
MIYIFSQSGEHSAIVTLNRSRKMREILGVALDLACDGGLDNLTLHRLAGRMKRSVAAVYRYFPSREAVISELQRLIATHINLIANDAQARVATWASKQDDLNPGDRALAAILARTLAYGIYAEATPDELGMVTRYLSTPDKMLPERDATHVFEIVSDSLDDLTAAIAHAQTHKMLTPADPHDRAVMLWAALQGSIDVLRVVQRGGRSPHTNLTRHMIETLMVGWGADHATLTHLTKTIIDHDLARVERTTRDLLSDEDPLTDTDHENTARTGTEEKTP